MANGTIKRCKEVKRHIYSFFKTVTANTQVSYSVAASDLGIENGEDVKFCIVHEVENLATVQPHYITFALAVNVVTDRLDAVINGMIYNPTTTDRTYRLTAVAITVK